MKHVILRLALFSIGTTISAQVGINNTSPNATLDITASNVATPLNTDGILIPRIDDFPVIDPTVVQDGMMVFATGSGTPTKGFYFWDQGTTSWVAVGSGSGTQNTLDMAYDEGGPGAGNTIVADNGAVVVGGTDGFWVTGTFGSGPDFSVTADLSNSFFNPRRSITRSGFASGTTWSFFNNGTYSVAMGYSPLASGIASTGFGYLTEATGDRSTAMGNGTVAPSFAETALGNFNTSYTPDEITVFDPDDRLLVIGNGTSSASRSNAFSVFKNGTVTINDAYNLPIADGTNGQVLSTDGAGQLNFSSIGEATTASNGLTEVGDDIRLGGNLTQNTTVSAWGFDLTVDLNTTGNFKVQDNGTSTFEVDNSGEVYVGDNLYWRETSTSGTNLGRLFGTTAGNLSLHSAGSVRTLFNANGDSYFNGGELGVGTNNPLTALDVRGNYAANYAASFRNSSTNINADGISVHLQATNPAANAYYVGFYRNSNVLSGRIEGSGPGTGVTYQTTSDMRLKTNFEPEKNALAKISCLNPVWYQYKSNLGIKEYGFLAQEVQSVFPQIVSGDPSGDVKTNPMTVAYGRLTPLLTAGIQELEEKISKLEQENLQLKGQLKKYDSLEARILALEKSSGNNPETFVANELD